MTDNEKKYAWSHLPGGKKHALEFWRLEHEEQPDPDDETLHQFLYVWCANASNGIVTAHPTLKGKDLSEIKGKHGAPFGKEIMQTAAEGTIKEVTDWWPRPGSDKPLEKETFFTKVGDQICGVGYYKK